MLLVRIARGVIGTAFTWAFAWAALGSLVGMASVLSPDTVAAWLQSPRALVQVALSGAWEFGLFGGLAGGAFALALAGSGRQLTFARLSARRIAVLGALGAGAIGATITFARSLILGLDVQQAPTMIAMTMLLGAGSSWAMWRIAQRGDDVNTPAQLPSPNSAEHFETRRSTHARATT